MVSLLTIGTVHMAVVYNWISDRCFLVFVLGVVLHCVADIVA